MEIFSLITAFYGFKVCYTWEMFSHSFFTVFLVTCGSVLEHSVNNLIYIGKISNEYKKWVLWLDRFTAVLSALSRYQTVEKKLCFIIKKQSLFTLVLYMSLDMGLWNDTYYDIGHSVWHLLAFSLLDKNYDLNLNKKFKNQLVNA